MDHGTVNPSMKLSDQDINGLGQVYYNSSEDDLIAQALERGEGQLGKGGTLLVTTGKFTGRSPKDKHVVRSATTEDTIWWENKAEMTPDAFDRLYD
ncbi:MAG: phosphoenolpyruvate carboxykinase (ATP), partial [Octadecabacter sp.]